MVHNVDITSPKRVAPSDTERGKGIAPPSKSSSKPGMDGPLKGRGGAQGKPIQDSKKVVDHHPASHPRPRSNTGIRIHSPKAGMEQAAKAAAISTAKALAEDDRRRDTAAQGILKMLGEPKRYVDDAGKSVEENLVSMQDHVENLQGMLQHRDAALSAQANLRMQMSRLDGHAEPERYESWAQAASINLEAVFQEAETAVRDMQARLSATRGSDADSDTDDYLDAQTDWSSEVEADTETLGDTQSRPITPQKQSVPVKAEAAPVRSEPRTTAPSLATIETPRSDAPESTPLDHTTATESPAALAQREADRGRHEMAEDLLALNSLNMGYHTSGALELVGNVRAMSRRIQDLEDVLAAKDEMLRGHADLVAQLDRETPAARLDWPQFKKWEAAAAVRPDQKFEELAASISAIKARMRNGVEHLTRMEGYTEAEIFPRSR